MRLTLNQADLSFNTDRLAQSRKTDKARREKKAVWLVPRVCHVSTFGCLCGYIVLLFLLPFCLFVCFFGIKVDMRTQKCV